VSERPKLDTFGLMHDREGEALTFIEALRSALRRVEKVRYCSVCIQTMREATKSAVELRSKAEEPSPFSSELEAAVSRLPDWALHKISDIHKFCLDPSIGLD